MTSSLLVGLQFLVLLAVVLSALAPGLRRSAAALLGLAGLWALGAGLWASVAAGPPRVLEIGHSFTAYVGNELAPKFFAIEKATAPGGAWALMVAAFSLGWGCWAWRRRHGQESPAFGAPLALAVSGCACILALEKLAAPKALLSPFDLAPDRVLWPATLGCALLLAKKQRRMWRVLLYLSLFIATTRLPLAIFGTLATRQHWGTHLDVHGTDFFVPPLAAQVGGLEVEAGSEAQLLWLVWLPQLVVYPALYMLSTGGLALLALMAARQKQISLGERPTSSSRA